MMPVSVTAEINSHLIFMTPAEVKFIQDILVAGRYKESHIPKSIRVKVRIYIWLSLSIISVTIATHFVIHIVSILAN